MEDSWRIGPVTLTGSLVQLVPLSPDHHDGLVDAVRDGDMWDRWYTTIPEPGGMRAEIHRRLALADRGEMIPFSTIRRSDGAVLGMTTYNTFEPAVPRLEIGFTWNRESAHGTGVNAESKLLLLAHAFDDLGCQCVGLRTQWQNHQSRAALERLGARQDGVLRSFKRHRNGALKDVVMFSVLAHEWPEVRAGLEHRLRRRR